jgi:CheY-like chemotaxis protein
MPMSNRELDSAGLNGRANSVVDERERLTMLCIEDNVSNFMLIQSVFAYDPGVELVWASSGNEGLEVARAQRPGLILLDVHLPDAFGEDVLRRLKSDPHTRAIPVIALTADARRHQRERLLAAGADAFFTKPITISKLREAVAGFRNGRARSG